MIIDTGKYIYFNKCSQLKKSYFFKILGINSKSYIGRIVSRIHDFFFINSRLLKCDYKKYFRKEYNSFIDYLDKKHNLFHDEIMQLNYNTSYFSEKHLAEQYGAGDLLTGDYDDNVIGEQILNILDIYGGRIEGYDFYED